jgi:hypothetical protein
VSPESDALGIAPPASDHDLAVFGVSRCLATRTIGHGDPNPRTLVWRSPPR